jgi:putative sigma-54 modulation protein
MHIYVNGKNIEITDSIKAYAKEKLGKVATHYDQIEGIDVMLTVIKNPSVAENHTAEVTCKLTTSTIHVTETAETMYASIDLVADKLARQVQKFKDKNLGKSKSDSIRTANLEESTEETEV